MKLLTTSEAARRLGVSVTRVQALISERRLPAQKIGRDFMIQEIDLGLVASRPAGRTPAQVQLTYWSSLNDFILKNRRSLRTPEPKGQRYVVFETIRGCRIAASIHFKDCQIWVDLTLGSNRKNYYDRLEKDVEIIEQAVGSELEWVPRSEGVESWILLRKRADPSDEVDWPRQHAWLCRNLEAFLRTFKPRLINMK